MKPVLVKTSAGPCYVPAKDVVPLVGEHPQEVLAAELNRYVGQTGLFEKEGAEIGLQDIVTTMSEIEAGYREARETVYTTENFDDIPHETTKLRRDIITSLAGNEPQLFEEDERQNLRELIYRAGGRDFSHVTYNKMIRYLNRVVKSLSVITSHGKNTYDRSTYRGWLSGETIHPEDLDVVVQIGYAIGSNELGERAIKIWDPNVPKGEKPYFTLVDFHRTATAIIRPPKGEGKGEGSERTRFKERVHVKFPDWYRALSDKLEPMMERHLIEAVIHDALIPKNKEEPSAPQEEVGLTRKLVTSTRDQADEMYRDLRRTRPRSRSQVLEGLLGKWVEITKRAYSKYFDQWGGHMALPGHQSELDIIAYSRWKNENGETISIPNNVINLKFLSPLFNFDSMELLASYNKWYDILSSVRNGRIKKDILKGLKKGKPQFNVLYPYLENVFNSSLILRSMYEFDAFCKDMTRIRRAFDWIDINLADPDSVISRLTQYGKLFSDIDREVLVKSGRTIEEERALLQGMNRELPQEITLSNSFLDEINTLDQYVDKGGKRSTVEVFGEIFDFFGLDYDAYRRSVTDLFLYLHDRVLAFDPEADQKQDVVLGQQVSIREMK